MYKNFIKIFFVVIVLFCINFNFVFAQGLLKNYTSLRDQTDKAADEGGFNIGGFTAGEGLVGVISVSIKAFLGLLGIIFLILIVYGGYVWMMARGSEQEVEKAKNIIQRAIIGLIIIVASYVITEFVFLGLGKALG